MIDWEYSRNQMCHQGFIVLRPENDYAVEMYIHIRPTDRTYNLISSERMKAGYDLFEGRFGLKAELIKHAKTVKELKEFADEHYRV